MPTLTATRQHASESSNGRTLNITYHVKTDGAFLDIESAIAVGAAAAEADYGIEAIDATHQRVTATIIDVTVQLSLVQYYDYVTWPGGGDPYAPRITSERTARIMPPQPRELAQAYEMIQKQTEEAPDSLVLNLDTADGKLVLPGPQPIYPPQENYAETFNVPRSLLTTSTFFQLSKMAYKLNESPMLLGGATWPAQTVMLLTAVMSANQNGGGQLALSFALGEEYDHAWTRTGHYSWGDTGTAAETMTGVKPFSQLTYDRGIFQKTEDSPAREELYLLYEHRVWPTSDLYSTFFGAPPGP